MKKSFNRQAKDKRMGRFLLMELRRKPPDIARINKILNKNPDLGLAGKDGNTALHLAARRGKADIARKLVLMGADSNACNIYGQDPTTVARVSGHPEVERVIILADMAKGLARAVCEDVEEIMAAERRQKRDDYIRSGMPLANKVTPLPIIRPRRRRP